LIYIPEPSSIFSIGFRPVSLCSFRRHRLLSKAQLISFLTDHISDSLSHGDPDIRKFQAFTLTLITCIAFTAVANAEVSLVYYPADANSPAWGENGAGTLIDNSTDRSITTLEIISAGGNFTPAGAAAGAFAPLSTSSAKQNSSSSLLVLMPIPT